MTIMEGQVGATVLLIFVVIVLYRYSGPPSVAFIEKPVLGLLDLSSGLLTSDLDTDRETLRSLFYSVFESTTSPPRCDVLLLYCQIEIDGRIRGSELGLRELIRESGARVVVVASETQSDTWQPARKKVMATLIL